MFWHALLYGLVFVGAAGWLAGLAAARPCNCQCCRERGQQDAYWEAYHAGEARRRAEELAGPPRRFDVVAFMNAMKEPKP